jgi:hypothetical protein
MWRKSLYRPAVFFFQILFHYLSTLSASLSSFLLLRSFLVLFPSSFTRRRHRSCSAPPAHAPRLSRSHLRTRTDYPGVAPSSARRLCVSAIVVSPVSLLVLCYCLSRGRSPCALCAGRYHHLCGLSLARCRGVIFLFASGGPVIVSFLPSPSSPWSPIAVSLLFCALQVLDEMCKRSLLYLHVFLGHPAHSTLKKKPLRSLLLPRARPSPRAPYLPPVPL